MDLAVRCIVCIFFFFFFFAAFLGCNERRGEEEKGREEGGGRGNDGVGLMQCTEWRVRRTVLQHCPASIRCDYQIGEWVCDVMWVR